MFGPHKSLTPRPHSQGTRLSQTKALIAVVWDNSPPKKASQQTRTEIHLSLLYVASHSMLKQYLPYRNFSLRGIGRSCLSCGGTPLPTQTWGRPTNYCWTAPITKATPKGVCPYMVESYTSITQLYIMKYTVLYLHVKSQSLYRVVLLYLPFCQQAMEQSLPSLPAGICSHCTCLVTPKKSAKRFTGTKGT